MAQAEGLPPVVDPDQAAAYLLIHRETVYKLIADGSLHGFKVGRRWRITRASIEALLAGEVA